MSLRRPFVSWCICFTLVAALVAAPSLGRAQGCAEMIEVLDTTESCVTQPTKLKFFEPMTFQFDGDDYLAVNTGNNIQLWLVNSSGAPTRGSLLDLQTGIVGDANYTLESYSMCRRYDGGTCLYGIANFTFGTELFEIGNAGTPGLVGSTVYDPSSGGFTFAHDGQQYVLSTAFGDDCTSGTPMYAISGLNLEDLEFEGCADPGERFAVSNGIHIIESGTSYLYLGDGDGLVRIFEVVDDDGVELEYLQTIGPISDSVRNFALEVTDVPPGELSGAHRLAAGVNRGTVTVWDVSDPSNPSVLASRNVSGVRYVALGWPFLFVADSGKPSERYLYRIDDFLYWADPTPLDPTFFSPDAPHNSHECDYPRGAVLSPGGDQLYAADYGTLKAIAVDQCSALDLTPYVRWLEIVAGTPGQHGSDWRTDVVTKNLSSTESKIDLTIHTSIGELKLTGVVPASGQTTFVDVMTSAGHTGIGTLQARSDQPFSMSARVYSVSAAGTVGQSLQGHLSSEGLATGESALLFGLRQEGATFRTNLSITNTGVNAASVRIKLFDANGTELTAYSLTVGAGLVVQETEPFKKRAGSPNVGWCFAVVEVTSGSGVFTSASVIDSRTNDATTVPMIRVTAK